MWQPCYCPTCGESLLLKKSKKRRKVYIGYCACCKSHILRTAQAFYVKKMWSKNH